MPVAFKSIGTITQGVGTSASTAAPSGVTSGDLLILAVHSSSSTNPATPSGWNLITNWSFWFSGYDASLFWRIATGGADDTPAVTVGSSSWHTVIARFDGHDAASPIDTFFRNHGANENDPYTINDLTIADNGSTLFLGSMSHFSGSGLSAPDLSGSGYTLRASQCDTDSCMAFYSGDFNAGTDGGASVDFSGSIRAGNFVVAIKPAAGGGGSGNPHYYRQQQAVAA